MKALTSLFLMAHLGFAGPMLWATDPPAPAFPSESAENIVIRSVHGHVAYWDGNNWTNLRPNMVLQKLPQIRPDADSSVDLSVGNGLALRFVADHANNVTAYLVKRTAAAPTEPAPVSLSTSSRPSTPSAVQIQAGTTARHPGQIEFAICEDGSVQVNTGEVTITGIGKTHVLTDREYFDAASDDVRRDNGSGDTARRVCSCAITATPKPTLFASGLENARRGIYQIGE